MDFYIALPYVNIGIFKLFSKYKEFLEVPIRITAAALGRKPKKEVNQYQKVKRKKEAAERNHIEVKFGQGKNGYNLNKIRAKLKATSESWISCIFFVMSLINYQ
jgi:hypothetical protein